MKRRFYGALTGADVLTNCQSLRHRHPGTLRRRNAAGSDCQRGMQPRLLVLDEAFSRLTSAAATGTLLEQLQQWALERHSLIVLLSVIISPLSDARASGYGSATGANPIMLTLNPGRLSLAGCAADCRRTPSRLNFVTANGWR